MRRIRVIVGPTAAGKSGRVMELARSGSVAIISADSRQIYRGFDIGTAKPSVADRDAVVHYGVDVADPNESYSAYRWAQQAAGWIADADARGLEPVIVGGTGFYIKSLFNPPYDEPPVSELGWEPEYERVDPGERLRDHIVTRIDAMLANGWVDEVRALSATLSRDAIAWKSCGYRAMRDHLEGRLSLDEARARAIIETRQYAKRQRTWFRHQIPWPA